MGDLSLNYLMFIAAENEKANSIHIQETINVFDNKTHRYPLDSHRYLK